MLQNHCVFSVNVLRKTKIHESGEGDSQQSMQIVFKNTAPNARQPQMWSGSMYIYMLGAAPKIYLFSVSFGQFGDADHVVQHIH